MRLLTCLLQLESLNKDGVGFAGFLSLKVLRHMLA